MLIRNIDYITDRVRQLKNAQDEEQKIEQVYIYDYKNLLQFILSIKNP